MVNGLIVVSPNPNEKIFMVDGLSPGEHGNKIFIIMIWILRGVIRRWDIRLLVI